MTRYWLQMSITAPGYEEDVFALEVRGGDRPVPLPAWVNESLDGAELTVVAYRADCEQDLLIAVTGKGQAVCTSRNSRRVPDLLTRRGAARRCRQGHVAVDARRRLVG